MAEWLSVVGRDTCDDCQETYRRSSAPTRWNPNPEKKEPPCGKCKPEFHPLNMDAAILYSRVSGQWNYHPTSGRATSLKTSEIESEMRILQVRKRDRRELLDTVRMIAATVCQCWDAERERLGNQT